LNTNVSQSSVATGLTGLRTSSGFVSEQLLIKLLLSVLVKKNENRSAFGKVIGKSRVSRFVDSRVSNSVREQAL